MQENSRSRVDGDLGRWLAGGLEQLLLRDFINAEGRGQNAGARVRNAQPLQQALNGAVLAARPVQGQKGEVHQARQLAGFYLAADLAYQRLPLLIAQLAQAFGVELPGLARGGQRRYRRVKVADGALVDVLPVEQNEVPAAVDEDGHGLEQGLVQVVIYGAPAGKGNFPLAGGAPEKNADFHK